MSEKDTIYKMLFSFFIQEKLQENITNVFDIVMYDTEHNTTILKSQ